MKKTVPQITSTTQFRAGQYVYSFCDGFRTLERHIVLDARGNVLEALTQAYGYEAGYHDVALEQAALQAGLVAAVNAQRIISFKAATPVIGKSAAAALHRHLGRFGKFDHHALAEEVLDRPVTTLAHLTEQEAGIVYNYIVAVSA